MSAPTDDPCSLGLAGLRTAFASGMLDPVAATEAYLARIGREDGALRSYITVDGEGARAAAEESQRRWHAGSPLGPLDGVPIALKDNIDVAGLPCTAGTAAFRERIPSVDAHVVVRLRQAGAVLLGKLNMHEGALGATTDNPVFGRCINPLRPGYTPGGSSGGSGAAVAAGLCAAALGTDTMGSIRVPAAYCGIYGFKPTKGAISAEGVIPLSFSLDCVGPLARSAEDLDILTGALLESTAGSFSPLGARPSVSGLRVGVPLQINQVELAPEVKVAFGSCLDRLRGLGAEVTTLDLPAWQPGNARRAGLLVAEAEGLAYYTAQLGADLKGLSDGFASMLRYAMKAGLMRVVGAYEAIEAVRLDCARAFSEVEVIALPTSPQMSFAHNMPAPVNQADLTALANFARAPALSLPLPIEAGLPAAVQLLAAPGDDRRLLALAFGIDKRLRAPFIRSGASASP